MQTHVRRLFSGSVTVALLTSGLGFAVSVPVAGVVLAAGTNGKIAFTSNRDGNDEIYVMDADGSNQTRLTNNTTADSEPAWSPDGTRIAFVSARDSNPEIYVMAADGTNPTRPRARSFRPTVGHGPRPSVSPACGVVSFVTWCDDKSVHMWCDLPESSPL